MLKDTKSLDNNKAPACESRGFVHKKRGCGHFDTPSFGLLQNQEIKPSVINFFLCCSIRLFKTSSFSESDKV